MNPVVEAQVIPCLFGRVNLAYVLGESRRLDEWQRFGRDGLGLHADAIERGVLALRIDEHARRIVIREGAAEDVTALGWQLRDESAPQAALARLRAAAIDVQDVGGDEAALRGVDRFWAFEGPKRLRFELFTQPLCSDVPLNMHTSGFVTGALGIGHVVLTTRQPEAMSKFFQNIFDARVSDTIEDRLNGIDLEMTFLRLNARHHTIGTAATRGKRMDPVRTRIHHLELQAKSLDDVTQAYRRLRELDFVIANGIGQHPNDRALSFYAASPAGLLVELGWNPREVTDEASWRPGHYRGISLWGHFPEGLTLGEKLRQTGRGLMSLTRNEYTVGSRR